MKKSVFTLVLSCEVCVHALFTVHVFPFHLLIWIIFFDHCNNLVMIYVNKSININLVMYNNL